MNLSPALTPIRDDFPFAIPAIPWTVIKGQAQVQAMPASQLGPKPFIISFRGPMGCGKTTAADHILSRDPSCVKISFADALKDEVFHALLGVIPEEIKPCLPLAVWMDLTMDAHWKFGPDSSKVNPEERRRWVNEYKNVLRPVLQYWGTEYRRGQNENYWSDQVLVKIRNAVAEGWNVVVDDARFENERRTLKDLHAYEVFIKDDLDRTAAPGISNHSSEAQNDPYDPNLDFIIMNFIVMNERSLTDLLLPVEMLHAYVRTRPTNSRGWNEPGESVVLAAAPRFLPGREP